MVGRRATIDPSVYKGYKVIPTAYGRTKVNPMGSRELKSIP